MGNPISAILMKSEMDNPIFAKAFAASCLVFVSIRARTTVSLAIVAFPLGEATM